ncbi:MAG TPA: glycosyltransferase [Polyangiaceae bacterium]|nr:glycosyltransferase [Polyangiaceae bacterium]
MSQEAASLPSVCVVIGSNRPGRLKAAVESVLRNDYPRLSLVVVAQGNAEGGGPSWAQRELGAQLSDARLRLVLDEGRGVSRARNIGMANDTSEIILFTDDDCIASPDWVARHVARYRDEPSTDMVFGAVLPPPGFTGADGEVPAFEPQKIVAQGRVEGDLVLGMGANMSAKRRVLEALGAFDEQIGPGSPLPSGEDIDLSLRAAARGMRVVVEPTASVWHDGVRAHGPESRVLWSRDGIGLGAVTAKCLRSGQYRAALMLTKLVVKLNAEAAAAVISGRRPTGLRRATLFGRGALQGLASGWRLRGTPSTMQHRMSHD